MRTSNRSLTEQNIHNRPNRRPRRFRALLVAGGVGTALLVGACEPQPQFQNPTTTTVATPTPTPTPAPTQPPGVTDHIKSGVWNLRSSIGGAVIGSLSGGQSVYITCQSIGPSLTVTGFGTSTIYDHLSSPADGWISDLAMTSTPYAVRDPRLPDCGGATPQPVASRAELAAQWAEARLGQTYTKENPNAGWWSGWCETFVEKAWSGVVPRYASADAHYQAVIGRVQGGVPPRGAIVFWGPNHTAISVGGGRVVSTQGLYSTDRLPNYNVAYTYFSGYRGWYMPG